MYVPSIDKSQHLIRATLFVCLCLMTVVPARAEIAVTLPPFAGLVSLLAPDMPVYCLLSSGADAHSFRMTPKQVDRLRHAELLVRNVQDDGGWLGLNTQTPTFDLWPKTDHAWLRPDMVRQVLPRLAARLQVIDPARKEQIRLALTQALALCDRMENAWRIAWMPFISRGVIMQHAAWRALCVHFGVPVRSILESGHHHESDITPRTLEQALHQLRIYPATVLLGNLEHQNQGLLWLAQHGSVAPPVLLDALGTCKMRWETLMQKNMASLMYLHT